MCITLPNVPAVERYLALSPPEALLGIYLPLTKMPVTARRVPDGIGRISDSHRLKKQSKPHWALA